MEASRFWFFIFKKSVFAAGIELVGAADFDAAFAEEVGNRPMQDGGPHLGLDVIPDDWQVLRGKAFGHTRIARNEDGHGIDERYPGLQGTFGNRRSPLAREPTGI